ncbi:BrnT family toxin [Bifidobacterium tibiigranuli]|uniref:BrnT family toxin n=2 Tax=Bifidobacterium tibiigranuli TaxID=2172043 RepID=UPI0034C5C92A
MWITPSLRPHKACAKDIGQLVFYAGHTDIIHPHINHTKRKNYMYNICNNSIHFEWDDRKALLNRHKHHVSFDEAQSVFDDPFARLIADPDHSEDEERFIILGMSKEARLLVVCHCYRISAEAIRIISARKATRTESTAYGSHYDAR